MPRPATASRSAIRSWCPVSRNWSRRSSPTRTTLHSRPPQSSGGGGGVRSGRAARASPGALRGRIGSGVAVMAAARLRRHAKSVVWHGGTRPWRTPPVGRSHTPPQARQARTGIERAGNARSRRAVARIQPQRCALLHRSLAWVPWGRVRPGRVPLHHAGAPFLPFKTNADRRHHIPKQQHRVTNWAAYDAGLCARGSLTVWFTAEAVEAWRAEPRTGRGGQPRYSALAITTALTLRAVFRLALRQTEGLIGSILALLGLDLPVPDHSTL